MDLNTEKLVNEFMDMLDHSYKYNTSNERINIERKLIDIAESAVKNLKINNMKPVWKCNFCSHIQEQVDGLKEHEDKCSFNPTMKTCFTCEHAWDSGYEYSIPECDKNLSTVDGMDKGNCEGWKEIINLNQV